MRGKEREGNIVQEYTQGIKNNDAMRMMARTDPND